MTMTSDIRLRYSKSAGRKDADSPIEVSLETALDIFRGLDRREGFLVIPLNKRQTVQFVPLEQGGTRVELLDHPRGRIAACDADADFAERLIRAAAEPGTDVFEVAWDSKYQWERSDI